MPHGRIPDGPASNCLHTKNRDITKEMAQDLLIQHCMPWPNFVHARVRSSNDDEPAFRQAQTPIDTLYCIRRRPAPASGATGGEAATHSQAGTDLYGTGASRTS